MYAARAERDRRRRGAGRLQGRSRTPRPIQEGTTALQLAIINIHYDLASLLLERAPIPNVAGLDRHDGALRGGGHARAGATC